MEQEDRTSRQRTSKYLLAEDNIKIKVRCHEHVLSVPCVLSNKEQKNDSLSYML